MAAASPAMHQRVFGADFQSPVLLASGTCGYGQEFAGLIPLDELGGLVTKAVSVEPRGGNSPHRIAETPGGMINAIGLENPGLKAFVSDKLPWLRDNLRRAHVLVNVVGWAVDDYAAVVRGLDGKDGFLGFEINVSCPNVKDGALFGTEMRELARLVTALRASTDRPLVVKLTPTVPDVGVAARVCEEAGADGVSAINTFPGMVVDIARRVPVLGNVSGGVSGPAILPMGVHATWRASRSCRLPVMGIGGIRTASEALQYILAGACLVQIGTASFVDPAAAISVQEGIAEHLAANGEDRLEQLVGTLRAAPEGVDPDSTVAG